MPLPSPKRLRAGRQMQVESSKPVYGGARGAHHLPVRQAIIYRERFETVPYSVRCKNLPRA